MFIDSHAHIDSSEFDPDREHVIERAVAARVKHILNVGTGNPHSGVFERAVELSTLKEFIYTAIGTHPHDARHYDNHAEEKTKRLLRENDRMIAWGEIGLDFHYDNSPRHTQREAFARQLRGASELNLPVIIHTREAETDTVEILKSEYSNTIQRGVFHCFSGSSDLARAALDLGFYISFSGIVTFKKADELRAIAKDVPLDRLLIETDCPFLTPVPYRGKRNEPAYVVEVARHIAQLRDMQIEELARLTSENFFRCFNVAA